MSLPLRDFRGKITHATHAALEARARAEGKFAQEIARDVLHEWAVREIEAATVLHASAKREGLLGEDEGKRGSRTP